MQHKAAIHLHRAAKMHGHIADLGVGEWNVDLVEQGSEGEVDRSVDHNAERPLLVMLTDISERLRKIGVRHVGHGNQKLIREVYILHDATVCGILYRPLPPGTNPA